MKYFCYFLILIISATYFSCTSKDTLCHQEQTIEALKDRLVESISDQSTFLSDEYGISQADVKLNKLFWENKIQLLNTYMMSSESVNDSTTICTCGIEMSFVDGEEFLSAIEPIVMKSKGINDKYSSAYLKNKHLVKYSEKKYYPFFFTVIKTNHEFLLSENDYKVGSLLIDYLKVNAP